MAGSSARSLAAFIAIAALLFMAACTDNAMVVGAPQPAGGQSGGNGRLVALLITDNTDHQYPNKGPGSIADGIARNAELMDTFFQRVAAATGMTLDLRKIAGSTAPDDPFTCDNITQTIRNLPVRPGDAVMVYYSGHGFNIGADNAATEAMQVSRFAAPELRNRPTTQFPFLACGTQVHDSPNLDLIATWLEAKQPRLTIVMADACNSFEGGSGPPAESFFAGATRGLTVDLRLRSLFVEAKGTVIMTGSQRGHYSYYESGFFNRGGMFTKEFLSTLAAMPIDQRTSWGVVGAQLTPMVVRVRDKRTGAITTDMQTPFLHVGPTFATAAGASRIQ